MPRVEPNEPTGGVSVMNAPYRDRFAIGMSRFMSRAVALVFRVRNDKPPETISRHQYGPNAAEYLELIPAAPDSPPNTPIVYFHGGGWISGSSDISTYRLLDGYVVSIVSTSRFISWVTRLAATWH